MREEELCRFIYRHIRPQAVEIEEAKCIILETLAESAHGQPPTSPPVHLVRRKLCDGPGPVPEGYATITPDLNEVKAKLITFEALQALHSAGAVVAFGGLLSTGDPGSGVQSFRYTSGRGDSGPLPGNPQVHFPVVYAFYQLATGLDHDHFLLGDSDVYLSRLQRDRLHSRVRRCLREAVNAFRHGDYLSASMGVGAASESMWLKLGRLVSTKNLPGSGDLGKELARKRPNLGIVLDETWTLLTSNCKDELKQVFPTSGEREAYAVMAERLRNRRNYAIHDEEADDDDKLFRFNEMGMLLLDAAKYFNQHVHLYDVIGAMPART